MTSLNPFYTKNNMAAWNACALFGIALAWAGAAAGAAEARPDKVVFHTPGERHTVHLYHQGEPLPAARIQGFKVYIGENDYDEMFAYTAAGDGVELRLTEAIEIGSYRVVFHTSAGEAVVHAQVPLDQTANSLEARARQLNMTVEQLRREMGLYTHVRERVTLSVPAVYYVGQAFEVPPPDKPGRTAELRVNGEVVARSNADAPLRYVFERTGAHLLGYRELEGDKVVAAATDMTEVTKEPALDAKATPSGMVNLQGPAGYGQYIWTHDGREIAQGPTLRHAMGDAASLLIEVRAADPQSPNLPPVRIVRYRVHPAAE